MKGNIDRLHARGSFEKQGSLSWQYILRVWLASAPSHAPIVTDFTLKPRKLDSRLRTVNALANTKIERHWQNPSPTSCREKLERFPEALAEY